MSDNPTISLVADNLRALFWPDAGMLCTSLRFHEEELLRRVEDLETARQKGSTAGIPLLYPWANRLASLHYQAAGRDVVLNSTPLSCISTITDFRSTGCLGGNCNGKSSKQNQILYWLVWIGIAKNYLPCSLSRIAYSLPHKSPLTR